LSQGQQLLHHKWAIVDEEQWIMGSANWTKAAFAKNEDFLLILSTLTKEQIQFLNRLWSTLEIEAA
jgi:phosphatidylserine/phosphatidylglycerophosphate/cardiolipin synthase-like enzyme